MAIALAKAFSPSFKVGKPIEEANFLKNQFAEWDTSAQVSITNEPGKRFKVGFVQILLECDVVFTFEKTLMKETYPLPILDSDPGMFPWYESAVAYSPEVAGTNGTVTVEPRLFDRPSSGAWWHYRNDATDPLLHVHFRKKFRTWLAVRRIDTPLTQSFEAILAQFNYVVEGSFNVFVDQPLGKRCVVATGQEKANKPELVWPTTPVNACVWRDVVANGSYRHVITPRNVARATVGPTGPVVTGVNVKDRARLFGG